MTHINFNPSALPNANGNEQDQDVNNANAQTTGVSPSSILMPTAAVSSTDSLSIGTQNQRGASHVLSTQPPTLANASGPNQQDLSSATQRMRGVTNGFTHPVNGALVLAMEEGTHNFGGGNFSSVNSAHAPNPDDHKKKKDKDDSSGTHAQAGVVRAVAGESAAVALGAQSSQPDATASTPSTSTPSASSTPSTSSAEGSSSGHGSGNVVGMNDAINVTTATLDSNNPNSQDAQAILDSSSEAPKDKKCGHNPNGNIENHKAQDLAKATGLTQEQSRTLIRAMNSNNALNGTKVHDQVATGEDTTIALALATLKKLNATPTNSAGADKIRDELKNVVTDLDKATKNGSMSLTDGRAYGKSISNLTSYSQQLAVDSGAQSLQDAPAHAMNLVPTMLV